MTTPPTPAGWYPDPEGPPGSQRWWDGTTWTGSRLAPPAAGAAAAPTASGNRAVAGLVGLLVALVVAGGAIALIASTSGSTARRPTVQSWAQSFCTEYEARSKELATESASLDVARPQATATFLDHGAALLDDMADSITELGEPDTTGGAELVTTLPANLRDGATRLRSLATRLRAGDTTALAGFTFKPAGTLNGGAATAWTTVRAEFQRDPSCASVLDLFG